MKIKDYVTCLITASILFGGCGLVTEVSRYQPRSAKEAARAFSDVFNAKEIRQAALLIHPARRDIFEENRTRERKRMKTWRLIRFTVGEAIMVRRGLPGNRVRFEYHDGRRTNAVDGSVVKVKEQWWIWHY